MDILTGAEMREADRRAIQEVGIPGRVLMESAGRGVAGAMEEHVPDLAGRSIVIVCGKGNNGGDGLVLLRTLDALGYDARAIVLAPFEELAPDALGNLQCALKLDLTVDAVTSDDEWAAALAPLSHADVIVDAVLGTGLTRAAKGLPARVIEDLNDLDAFTVAVDVPSGMSADTGSIPGATVNADLTVALAAAKVCHFVPPACERCGTVEIVEIGIPPVFLEGDKPGLTLIEPETLSDVWPRRKPSSHKGTFGHLLIVAGSRGKTGAAVMAAEAALRAGVGLVTVASAQSAIPIMATRLPEAMWEPLPETPAGAIGFAAAERLDELLADRAALALGPGLGLDDETVRVVKKLVSDCRVPTVVDADGLNALRDHKDVLPSFKPMALTPHPGEAARLLGCSTAAVQRDRLQAVRGLATGVKASVLLKGYRTLVSDASGHTHVNVSGNPGLAAGGTGDVLTGIVGALMAQGAPVESSLVAGAYVHGLAGDLAAANVGATSLMATDVIAELPDAIHSLGAD